MFALRVERVHDALLTVLEVGDPGGELGRVAVVTDKPRQDQCIPKDAVRVPVVAVPLPLRQVDLAHECVPLAKLMNREEVVPTGRAGVDHQVRFGFGQAVDSDSSA